MAKFDEDLIMDNEQNAPMIIKRYIAMFRRSKGSQARRNSAKSRDWFRMRVSKDLNHKTPQIHKQFLEEKRRQVSNSKYLIGRMFLYGYDAKHKDKLPVWDAWPMVFFFDSFVGDGMTYGEKGVLYMRGINIHYLPPALRLKLFAELIKTKNDSSLREKSKLKLSWRIIKAMAGGIGSHAVKTYRADHIMTQLAEINPRYWEIAIFLQLAQWQKGGKKDAWKGIK